MVKRAQVTSDTFGEKAGAIQKLVSNTPMTADPAEQEEQPGTDQGGRKQKPTSFYLDDTQLRKLDKLAYEYNEQRGTRINRNHIVRHLVGAVELGELLRVDLKKK